MLTKHALAVSEDGKLYGWGSNEGLRIGFDKETQPVNKPTLIPFFARESPVTYHVLDISCGEDHSLIHLQEIDSLGHITLRTY